jgi:hypothetical protein
MKAVAERLMRAQILCPKLTPIAPATLGSRKRIELYLGVDREGYYCSVMIVNKKSRVLRAEAEELMQLHARLEVHADTAIRKRYIGVDAPLCSKAKALMEQSGWRFV